MSLKQFTCIIYTFSVVAIVPPLVNLVHVVSWR
jgi:hypothetical protein